MTENRQAHRETIARAIHEDYVRNQRAKGETPETNPSMVDWDELPEGLKESNRSQADDIDLKLKAVGCDTEPLADVKAPPLEFSPEEVEVMAKLEHDRWVAERLGAGWTFAPGDKDIERKTSPYLAPWAELSEDIRELDRNPVRAIPELLKSASLRVVRARPEISDT